MLCEDFSLCTGGTNPPLGGSMPFRGRGAAQKIDREKSCGSPKSQPPGAYRCRNLAMFVSESKNICYSHAWTAICALGVVRRFAGHSMRLHILLYIM